MREKEKYCNCNMENLGRQKRNTYLCSRICISICPVVVQLLSSCCSVVVQWITVQQTKNNRGTIEQQWKVNMMGGKVKTKLI